MLTSRHKLVFKSLVCVIQFFEKTKYRIPRRILSDKIMLKQREENCATTKMYSKFPPSLNMSSCGENGFAVVKLKRRKLKEQSLTSSTSVFKTLRSNADNNAPFNDNDTDDHANNNKGCKSFLVCGHRSLYSNANHIPLYNIFLLLLIVILFNTQITLQRPVHDGDHRVEQGSLTSAMVS